MRLILPVAVLLLAAKCLQAGPLPLTAKEISLMLRSGYSSEAVAQELAMRHFAGSYDEATKKSLSEAGASAALVTAIANGTYAMPPGEAIRAQEQLAAQAKRRAAEAEESRKFNTLYQSRVAQSRAAAPPVTSENTIYPLLKNDLVRWHDGSLVHFDDEALEKKKLYALYFSAHWCAPCRKFTPQLVEYYNRVAPQHPEFEIILISYDRSLFGFETYMKEMQMPWPAIDYSKIGSKEQLKKYVGEGIPDLVLIDASGKVISDSYAGKEYLGPSKVLADLDNIFARGGGPAVAQGR